MFSSQENDQPSSKTWLLFVGLERNFTKVTFGFPLDCPHLYIISLDGELVIYLSAHPLDKHLYNLIFISRFWGKPQKLLLRYLTWELDDKLWHTLGKRKREPRALLLVFGLPFGSMGYDNVCRLDVSRFVFTDGICKKLLCEFGCKSHHILPATFTDFYLFFYNISKHYRHIYSS